MHRPAPLADAVPPDRLTSVPEAAEVQPRASTSTVDGVDGYSRSVAGVQVEAVRTGLGTGPNRVLTVHDERLSFTSSDIGFPLRTRTTIGDDHVVIGCVRKAPPGSRWCELDLRAGTVVAYGSGAEHTGISLPGLHFEFATVSADRLGERADRIGSPLELPRRGQVHELTSQPSSRRVRSSMPELAAAAATGDASLQSAADELITAMVLALTNRSVPDRRPRRIDSRHVIHQCMDYANAIGRIPSLSELCLTTHVSGRTLRQAFVDEFDLPPARFFRHWALTVARQRLESSDARCTVTDVALDLGFTHMSRFSAYYRQLYGETPSTTLRASRRAA